MLAEGAEEVEQEEETRRLQQELDGGQFCALTVSGGTVSFADPACVPVAPVRYKRSRFKTRTERERNNTHRVISRNVLLWRR